MNVNQLHRALAKLIAEGHGRKPVVINKNTFEHPLEQDGVCMLGVHSVGGPKWIPMTDDDGGTKWNKDGTESGTNVVVIVGDREEA